MLALLSNNQAMGTLTEFMHFGDQQDVLADDPRMLYSAWDIKTPCLRELVLCFHMRRCPWLLLSCGIISEQDSSRAHWGKASSLRFSQLAAGMLFP